MVLLATTSKSAGRTNIKGFGPHGSLSSWSLTLPLGKKHCNLKFIPFFQFRCLADPRLSLLHSVSPVSTASLAMLCAHSLLANTSKSMLLMKMCYLWSLRVVLPVLTWGTCVPTCGVPLHVHERFCTCHCMDFQLRMKPLEVQWAWKRPWEVEVPQEGETVWEWDSRGSARFPFSPWWRDWRRDQEARSQIDVLWWTWTARNCICAFVFSISAFTLWRCL